MKFPVLAQVSGLVLPALLLLGSVSTAVAEPYVGFGVGTASYKVDLNSLGGGNFDDDSTGSKLYLGYSFNKYFAAEVNVYNFAEASVAAVEVSPGTFASASASMKGVGAYAVGMYPISKKVSLMAKLGVLKWDADLQVIIPKLKTMEVMQHMRLLFLMLLPKSYQWLRNGSLSIPTIPNYRCCPWGSNLYSGS